MLEWGIPGNNQLLWNAPKLAEGLVGGMRNTGGGTEWGERRTRAVDLLIASASIRCVGCGIGRIICIDPLHEETMRLNERNIVKAYTKKKQAEEKKTRQLLTASSNSLDMTRFSFFVVLCAFGFILFVVMTAENDSFIVFYAVHTSQRLLPSHAQRLLPSGPAHRLQDASHGNNSVMQRVKTTQTCIRFLIRWASSGFGWSIDLKSTKTIVVIITSHRRRLSCDPN